MSEIKIKQHAIAEAESALVREVRMRETVSRVELAKAMGLAPSTVGQYVDRLIDEGILREGAPARRTYGRPPRILELNPDAGQFLGIDFDARQIAAVAVDFSQQVVEEKRRAIRADDDAEKVTQAIAETVAALSGRRRLLGIGLAVPGIVDNRQGIAVRYEHIRGWRNVPLVETLSRTFPVPIELENNIRAMALAEQWFGQARRVAHFACVGIRSGIGAGIVIDGRLRRGHCGLAGEIGSWPCGPIGKSQSPVLEEVASVRAILAGLTEKIRDGAATSLALERRQVTLEAMLAAARDGDRLVSQTLARAAGAVGRAIGQLCLLINPEKVIIAGPLAGLSDAFLKPVREEAETAGLARHGALPTIVASRFGDFGAALGAAALAVHQWKPCRSNS